MPANTKLKYCFFITLAFSYHKEIDLLLRVLLKKKLLNTHNDSSLYPEHSSHDLSAEKKTRAQPYLEPKISEFGHSEARCQFETWNQFT